MRPNPNRFTASSFGLLFGLLGTTSSGAQEPVPLVRIAPPTTASAPAANLPPLPLSGPVLTEIAPPQTCLKNPAPARSGPFASPNEDELRERLRAVPEVGLTLQNLHWLARSPAADRQGKHALETLLGVEPDRIRALPFDFGPSCKSEPAHAGNLDTHARNLRPSLRFGGVSRSTFLLDFGWLRAESVGARVQMLTGADADWRLALTQQLSFTPGKEASQALANRAVFDLNPEVRQTALSALRDRPQSDYADVLARAFRYPWAPVADHAAQAVATLKVHELKTPLTTMLELPDPMAPTKRLIDGQEKYVVPQMVRVNHLKNCMLCHQRSEQGEGMVLGGVPDWDQPLPSYDDFGGPARVRADIVYLRQDFSTPQPVEQPRHWPREQRFDYFHRLRALSADEANVAISTNRGDYPQREAVLFALRSLETK